MDGGGRLDQPLRRSRQSAANPHGAPVDEPASARAHNSHHRRHTDRLGDLPGFRSLTGRSGAKIAHVLVPSGIGVVATALLLAVTLGYGAVSGQHVPDVVKWLKDARDVAANSVGF